jgi:hypothetical protein
VLSRNANHAAVRQRSSSTACRRTLAKQRLDLGLREHQGGMSFQLPARRQREPQPLAAVNMDHPAPQFNGPRKRLARALSEVDISYRSRGLVRRSRPITVGDRAPNAQVRNPSGATSESSLYDVLDHERRTLMLVGAGQHDRIAAAAKHADQIRVLRIGRDNECQRPMTSLCSLRPAVRSSTATAWPPAGMC